MKKQEIETWVPAKCIKKDGSVLDFTGLYEVSDMGRIRSLNYHRTGKTKELRLGVFKNCDGTIWYNVVLYKGNKKYTLKVHRIVLSSFKECEYFPGAVCDHIDARSETYCNNCLDNLHWVTQKQNVSTERCKTLMSEKQLNDPEKSKRVHVKDLTTGEITAYPSACEVERILGLPRNSVSLRINFHNGYYKKRQLYFEYIN